jgi:predicted type IV restriction endonuclease
MNEAESRADLIDPLLAAAGWDVVEAKCCALSAN